VTLDADVAPPLHGPYLKHPLAVLRPRVLRPDELWLADVTIAVDDQLGSARHLAALLLFAVRAVIRETFDGKEGIAAALEPVRGRSAGASRSHEEAAAAEATGHPSG
jgi:hypothetical protein